MLNDLRHAVRMLAHARGWTAIVVLLLALGIGANAALFSGVNGLLLRQLPVSDPDTLVRLRYAGQNDMVTSSSGYGSLAKTADGESVRATFSYPMYQQFVADNQTMTGLFACAPYGRLNVSVDGQAELGSSFIVTGNYFQVLGINARLGRTLLPDDDRPGAAPVATISSPYWHRRFGSDPSVIGRTVKMNGVAVTLVGVLPPEFTGVQRPSDDAPEITVPLALDPQLNSAETTRLTEPTNWWLEVLGRLKPGTTAAQVEGNLAGVFQHTARAGLDAYLGGLSEEERNSSGNRDRTHVPRLLAQPGALGAYDANPSEVTALTILTVIVALILLIVCANVANLLLSRAAFRQKEIAVRASLGATRGRLVRQLLTESLLLSAIGGALGVGVAWWGVRLLPGAAGRAPVLDVRVLAFITAITIVTGMVFGLAPALRGTGSAPGTTLKQSGRSVIGGRSVLSRLLLVAQVAISLVLIVGAALFVRTLQNLRQVDVGFNPANLLLFRVSPQLNGYDQPKIASLYATMLDQIATVPGVRSVSLSQPALLSGSVNTTSIFVQGRVYPASRTELDNGIHRVVISPGFFDTLGVPLMAGRAFTDRDDDASTKVVVINEAAVRKYFAGENPIGRRFGSSVERAGELEIVGVLRDVRYNSLREPAPPTMYVPYRQARLGGAVFEVRTAVTPASATSAVRAAVQQVDPDLPVTDVSTQIEQIAGRFEQEEVFARACSLFGAVALFIAAIGLFGLMSYSVARRTNEIGIRMALGAQRGDVLRMVLRESMTLAALGIGVGIVTALAASRLLTKLLFGLQPGDPTALMLAVVVMFVVAALAGYLPARRASRVDPMVALRNE